MIYIGQYYEDLGVNTALNITRVDYNPAGEESAKYVLEIVNNITNKTYTYDTDNGMTLTSDNPYYYTFDNIDTDSLTDGEYTYTLYRNEVKVASGLLTYRKVAPINKAIYEKTNEYIVYK